VTLKWLSKGQENLIIYRSFLVKSIQKGISGTEDTDTHILRKTTMFLLGEIVLLRQLEDLHVPEHCNLYLTQNVQDNSVEVCAHAR
jgi:hypothetical protein